MVHREKEVPKRIDKALCAFLSFTLAKINAPKLAHIQSIKRAVLVYVLQCLEKHDAK
jgi:hypothetical protein